MTNIESTDQALSKVLWKWVDEVIIGEQFCPFAKVPREKDSILLRITQAKSGPEILAAIATECKYLDDNPAIETTLLACSNSLSDFYDYLDVLEAANLMLDDIAYSGVYQLASFHPDYLFEGETPNDISHYTNRSPVPIFHLIREKSITLALQFVDDPQSIPARNIEHANTLGKEFFERYLIK